MQVEVNKQGSTLTVIPVGRIDSNTAPEFGKQVENNMSGMSEMIMDFSKLEYISSAGLRVLLTTKKAMDSQGGNFKIVKVNDAVMDVLNITGFVDILDVEV